jgi:hypothetical protein
MHVAALVEVIAGPAGKACWAGAVTDAVLDAVESPSLLTANTR